MRNISFDESSVLREFARIAVDKGLVKVAEVPVARPMPAPAPAVSQPAPAIETSKNAPAAMPKPAPQANPLVQEYNRLSGVFDQLLAKHQQDVGAAHKSFQPYLNQSIANIEKQYGKANADKFRQAALKGFGGGELMIAQKADDMDAEASVEASQVKQAKDETSKHYDVSGETGEDLVGQAHPGGGTKTEVTHSKTKENLVETIVEQQEADLEVARKAPKGTYAALAKLHDALVSMGHEDKLSGLKDLMAQVATVDEVVGHTLLSLADTLDGMGYRTAADTVDSLLKKRLTVKAQDDVDPGIAEYGGSWPTSGNAGEEYPKTMQLDPMVIQIDRRPDASRGQKSGPQLAPGGTPAVQKWQMNYNKRHGDPNGLRPLVPDGRWGIQTQKAYEQLKQQPVAQQQTQVSEPELVPIPAAPLAPPATPSAPLGAAGIRGVYEQLTGAVQNKYPKINLYDPQWGGLRSELWGRAQQFSSEDVAGQVERVMNELNINRMNELRRNKGPAMPRPRVGR